jgi:hypothetical protein
MQQSFANRLLASAASIAVGAAIVVYIFEVMSQVNAPLNGWFAALLWIVGGMMIGGGAFAPFKMTSAGIAAGFVIQIVSLATIVARGFQSLGGL